MPTRPLAAVATIGTELTTGLRVDTNASEVAALLTAAGYRVTELASAPDDIAAAASLLARLTAACDLVITTGGLGPTHDDITREAAAEALSRRIVRDPSLVAGLRAFADRHRDPGAKGAVFRQADRIDGARMVPAVLGSAPGQIVPTPRGHLVLLPGPPREMRPMLNAAFETLGLASAAHPFVACTTGLSESDVQVTAEQVLASAPGITLTLLARPGEVRVLLIDEGAGEAALTAAGGRVCEALGDACFSDAGETLAETVLRHARTAGVSIATAESCTGGMVAAALTDVPGASAVFLGGVVSYADEVKSSVLGVDPGTIAAHGAVSHETALEMAAGVRRVTGADWTVAVTGVAGPDGGTPDKPVGTVWFAVHGPGGPVGVCRSLPGDRWTVRTRATAVALDLLRLAIVAIDA